MNEATTLHFYLETTVRSFRNKMLIAVFKVSYFLSLYSITSTGECMACGEMSVTACGAGTSHVRSGASRGAQSTGRKRVCWRRGRGRAARAARGGSPRVQPVSPVSVFDETGQLDLFGRVLHNTSLVALQL